jgi:hypothetical protein
MFKDSGSLGHALHVFHLCFVPVLFSFMFFFLCFLAYATKTHKAKQHRNKTQMENMQSVTKQKR